MFRIALRLLQEEPIPVLGREVRYRSERPEVDEPRLCGVVAGGDGVAPHEGIPPPPPLPDLELYQRRKGAGGSRRRFW